MQPRLEKPMADRTDELKERVAALDSMHDEWLRKMQCSFGRMMGLACKLPGMRWFIEVPFSRLASYLVVDRQTCGEERGCKSDVLDIAENYLKIPTLLRMPCRVAEATDERVLIEWDECAIGLDSPGCLKACDAACASSSPRTGSKAPPTASSR